MLRLIHFSTLSLFWGVTSKPWTLSPELLKVVQPMAQDKMEPSPEARQARLQAAERRRETERQIAEADDVIQRLAATLDDNHIAQKVRSALAGVLR